MASMAHEHLPSRTARRDPRLLALSEDSGYEIHERIGAGGMGIVYRGHDADGTEVAIKLLRHEIADDPRARQRLAREVAAQRKVRHDSIVRILDAELDSADAFVVTEFVPGPTLEDAVRDYGPLHPELIREIAATLGNALQEIHRVGVVHRDLKPSNILLRDAEPEDFEGYDPHGARLDPVIIDFGIAIAAEESRLTATGLMMGTAAYLDPEVVRSNQIGEAGDWWALAALLAFAATGREPYGTGRADLVFLRADRGEIDLEGLPTDLSEWLREALQADPAQRPSPECWLMRIPDLDLKTYPDPGATEFITPADAAPSEPATEVLSSTRAGAATGAGHGGYAEAPGADRTEMLSPVGPSTPSDPVPYDAPTERIEVVRDATRPLPVIQEDYARPADDAAGWGGAAPVQQTGWGPTGGATPAPPVQRSNQIPMHAPVQQTPTPPVSSPYARQPMALTAQPSAMPPQGTEHHGGYPQAFPPSAAGPMMPHGSWPTPMPSPPRRPALVWLGHLLLIGTAAVAPYVSLFLLLLLGGLARGWEGSHRAITDSRLRGSEGSGPLWAAGIAWPFRFLLGVIVTVLQAIFPLALGLVIALAIDAGWRLMNGTVLPDGLLFGIAMAVTVLITWVGFGARTTRLGAHRMVDAAAPDLLWTSVVVLLLLLLIAAVTMTIIARDGMVDYFPFLTWPRLDDLAMWRN